MPTKIGHFEILSELSKSATGAVYKATDPQTSQTVALKAIHLSAFGERAGELEKCLREEAETTKVLSHSNLPPVFGAGEIDGQFCAAMEYIQGNSIATMLANKEGFSIWDLLDIGRQVCSGLDHAGSHKVFHYSLEPAKIMCGWDGTVRVLGYGVSSVGRFTGQMPGVPAILQYMSPEQVRGENIDARSNLFSLGAMFYEMVTAQKPFDQEDAESLRQSILESEPVTPNQLNPKLHPGLSKLIMKAIAKDPGNRYQNGRELLDDLENCKESKPQAAKQAAPTKSPTIPDAVKAATQAKFIASASPASVKPASATVAPNRPAQAKAPIAPPVQSKPVERKIAAPPAAPAKVTATAAGAGGPAVSSAPAPPSASMSSPVFEEPAIDPGQSETPKIAVDPMMAGDAPSRGGSVSFSDMTELPPLKEVYIAPPPPPAFDHTSAPAPNVTTYDDEPAEKPKVQPREVAQKAMKEIKNVPPSLMVYSIAGAAVLILIIAVVLVLHVNSLNNDGDSPRPAAAEVAQPAASQPVAQSHSTPSQQSQPEAAPAQPSAPVAESEPEPTQAAAAPAKGKSAKKKPAPTASVVVPGLMAIDSTPQGAQVQIDGKTDPSWITPFTLSGLAVGQHTVTVSKAGYSPDSRTVDVTSGAKSFVTTHLAQLVATLSVSSSPSGANIFVDGKNSGKLTPAQVPVDQGQHVVLIRKSGFIDETTSAQFTLGQIVNFSPTLRALGNVDDIKTVGKMKMKFFGGKEAQGMGTVSVKTQPKGAQVAVNQHMLDKDSPVDFTLDPGNYIVDITMSGYVPIHKVISVDKGGKAVIDEVMRHE
ncbi:MAG TPA: PEGA domain-containing protein [Candidatus Acidoferrum sp.]|jgi:serine/threonine protein kinase|nr:PEGA domain-containing protein [Candidatus Acidoferrum sp.]